MKRTRKITMPCPFKFDMEEVRTRIRDLREKHEYKQEDVANYLGEKSTDTYGRYERFGKSSSDFSIETLFCLSKLYGVTADYILTGETTSREPSVIDAKLEALREQLSLLPEATQLLCLAQLENAVKLAQTGPES